MAGNSVPQKTPARKRGMSGHRDVPPAGILSRYASPHPRDRPMIGSFTFENLPCRVVFGSGTLATAAAEIERLGGRRALVLTTPPQQEQGRKLGVALGPLFAGIFPGA